MWPPVPPLDGMPVLPADRVRMIILDDSTLSNAEIALRARATVDQVGDVRRALEGWGVLPPRREPRRAFPQHVPLPPAPRSLQEGRCVGVLPSPWVSDDPAERTHARVVCITECHVAQACLDWALRAVPVDDSAIYAGTGPSERRALRAERGIRRPNAVAAINAAKTTCPSCGEALSGENLIEETWPPPRRCPPPLPVLHPSPQD